MLSVRRELFRFTGAESMRLPEDLNPALAAMFSRWQLFAREGVPSRRHFDLPDLPERLRGSTNLVVVELSEAGDLRFRFRLFGSKHRMQTRLPPTGQLIEDVIVDPAYLAMLQDHYRQTVESRWPRLDRVHTLLGDGIERSVYAYERLILPLSGAAGGHQVAFLMTFAHRAGLNLPVEG